MQNVEPKYSITKCNGEVLKLELTFGDGSKIVFNKDTIFTQFQVEDVYEHTYFIRGVITEFSRYEICIYTLYGITLSFKTLDKSLVEDLRLLQSQIK